jgi:hypothetical protein
MAPHFVFELICVRCNVCYRLMNWSLGALVFLSQLQTALNIFTSWLITNLINKFEHSAMLSDRWVNHKVWRALVNAVMNIHAPWSTGKPSSGYTTGGLLSSAQLHRASLTDDHHSVMFSWFRLYSGRFYLQYLIIFHCSMKTGRVEQAVEMECQVTWANESVIVFQLKHPL